MTLRRGPFRPGERVQLTDPKGRHYTINLTVDGYFQSTRGSFRHSELIGKEEGSLITTEEGREFLALRPLLSDYVLSMPRGATIVYPKDAAQITHMADIYPGARVFEAGVGSGALSISLLQAVGPQGFLLSAERRPEFAEIAQANLVSWWGSNPENWQVECGEAADILAAHPAGFDRVILDMLAPWEIIRRPRRLWYPAEFSSLTLQRRRSSPAAPKISKQRDFSPALKPVRHWCAPGI